MHATIYREWKTEEGERERAFFWGGGGGGGGGRGGGALSLDITHNGIKFKLLDITVYIQGMENRGRERGRGGGRGRDRETGRGRIICNYVHGHTLYMYLPLNSLLR